MQQECIQCFDSFVSAEKENMDSNGMGKECRSTPSDKMFPTSVWVLFSAFEVELLKVGAFLCFEMNAE